jgi:DNA repair exonuclease SbcCD ATPase subunit
MTCKEKYMQEHPDEDIKSVVIRSCPMDFGYLGKPSKCYIAACGDDPSYKLCRDCWNREIPETEVTKKEKENMCECKEKAELIEQVKDYQSRLEEVTELWQAAEEKIKDQVRTLNSRAMTIIHRNETINSFAKTNEDLSNQLAAERAKNMKLQDMVVARDEEIDKLVKENDDLMNAMAAKNEEIMNLRAEKDAMAARKAKVIAAMKEDMKTKDKDIDILKVRVENQVSSIKYLCDRNKWLNDQVDAKNKRIQELCSRIDKLDEARYIEQDITMTKDLYELLRQARPIVIPKEEPTICPINETPYARYANHIRMKYKALTDNGFSHDDAMSLIPMWDDNEFEGFKHRGRDV